MKFFAIFLCIMVIRYSSAGYVKTRNDKGTFDGDDCFHKNKSVWDTLEAAAEKEDRVLESLEKSNSVPTDVLDQYKAAVTLERKTVKEHIFNARRSKDRDCWSWRSLLGDYRRLMLCDADPTMINKYDFRTLRGRHTKFFTTPSATLDKYYAMKKKERATFYRYYYRGGLDLYEKPTGNEFEGGVIEEGMKVEFEYTKRKRDSESQTPKMHAQVFVIFLCMVIGILVVDLQRLEIGEDDLKANKNAMKVKRSFPRTDRIVSTEMRVDCISLDGNRL